MHKYLLILFILFSSQLFAQDLSIGLFSELSPKHYALTIQQGTYSVRCDSLVLDTIAVNQNVSIQLESDIIVCSIGDSVYKSKGVLVFEGNPDASFFINCVGLNTSLRCYKGDIRFVINNNYIRAINSIDLEDYVAAVVEAEAGYKHNLEYYKTQAVICRTYAISHIGRHKDEAYDLCDNVHCQMYPYKSMNEGIRTATQTTQGMILVDSSYVPIIAAYHSNSGGFTANSEDVWVSKVSYLRSVYDSISNVGNNAEWSVKLSLSEWKQFLIKYGVPNTIQDSLCMVKDFSREKNILIDGVAIPVNDFRKEFQLRSAFFTTVLNVDTVQLMGKGYGHGVGLSQEGAMQLAIAGWDYQKILKHYYTGVFVVKLQTVQAFKQLK